MPILISDTQSQVLVNGCHLSHSLTVNSDSPWRMFWAPWHAPQWTLRRLGPWLSSSLGPGTLTRGHRSHGWSRSWCWSLERTAGTGTSAQISLSHSLLKRTQTRPGVGKVKPRYGLSTPYRLTIRNSARLLHHVLFKMGDLHLVLPALNLLPWMLAIW